MAKKAKAKIEDAEPTMEPERATASKELVEKVKKELVGLTGFKSPAATGFKEEGGELVLTIEVIEKESIPTGMDVLGTYEVHTDEDGKILSYERTDLRKRSDTALSKEE